MRSPLHALLLALAALLLVASPAGALTLPAGFESETAADGLDLPTAVDWDSRGRAFVAEKDGRVKIVDVDGSTKTLLDISGHVNNVGDRGLLGLALDADFDDNGYLYLLYVNDPRRDDGDEPTSSRLTRVTVGPGDTAGPETIVVGRDSDGACGDPAPDEDCLPADADTHVIGTVHAAADGSLWLGSGDGIEWSGGPFTPMRTGDPDSLAGKVLHVDRDGRGLVGHPLCPGRPLTENCTKVFAMGFRNPFRFVPRDDGAVVVADVGQNDWEELDIAHAGGDYGWPCYEGAGRTSGYEYLPDCGAVYARAQQPLPPVWSYSHEPGIGGSIIAGPPYQGDAYPAGYRGTWFVGDYVRNWIRRVTFSGDAVTSVTPFIDDARFVDLESDPDGNLVLVDIGTGNDDGALGRIVYTPGNAAPVVAAAASPSSGSAPLTVGFSSAGTRDPDGDPLGYAWDFGDGSTSSNANPTHTFTERGDYSVRLRVSDGRGRSGSALVHVTVSGPRPTITSPADGSTYRAGGLVALTGTAVDDGGAQLPPDALRWDLLLVHGTHNHPGTSATGAGFTFRAADDHDADSYYRVTLTATDRGATGRTTITLHPETIRLLLGSDPPGAPLSYGGEGFVAPVARDAAIGFRTTVAAASSFTRAGRSYELVGWSDGGAQAHALTVPDRNLELVARYRDVTPQAAAPQAAAPPAGGDAVPVIGAVDRASHVSVRWPAAGAAVDRLRGTASDADGVKAIQVAIVRVEKRGCRWWSAKDRRLASRPSSCDAPHWSGTTASGSWWTASLRARLRKGKYTVIVRVTDRARQRTEFKYRSRRLGR
jgi:Glucose / Sorbosone dehydrogenase/PKD domain